MSDKYIYDLILQEIFDYKKRLTYSIIDIDSKKTDTPVDYEVICEFYKILYNAQDSKEEYKTKRDIFILNNILRTDSNMINKIAHHDLYDANQKEEVYSIWLKYMLRLADCVITNRSINTALCKEVINGYKKIYDKMLDEAELMNFEIKKAAISNVKFITKLKKEILNCEGARKHVKN